MRNLLMKSKKEVLSSLKYLRRMTLVFIFQRANPVRSTTIWSYLKSQFLLPNTHLSMVKLTSTSERKQLKATVTLQDYNPNYQQVRGKRNLLKKRNLSLASLVALMATRINAKVWGARGTRTVPVSAADNWPKMDPSSAMLWLKIASVRGPLHH